MQLQHKYLKVEQTRIHYVEAKPEKPKGSVIFLHGFPEYWGTWQAQLEYFSEHYRVIAPDLPGYNLSDKPQTEDFFQLTHLVEFMAKFVQALAPNEKVYLVAHDWGGVIAWPLAAFYPHLFEKLVIINAAHPSIFTREMISNPVQRQKSQYIHDLIAEDGVKHIAADNFAYLRREIFGGMPRGTLSEEQKQAYQQVWSQPGAADGMLQYYRVMPQLAPSGMAESDAGGPLTETTAMKIPNIRISLTTLILWGEQDQAFVVENTQGLEDYVTDCTIKRFPIASHWLQHELPDEVNREIAHFISH